MRSRTTYHAPRITVLMYPDPKIDLSVNFCGVKFKHPFILAAAPPSDDLEMVKDAFRAGWAGAVLKTTSVEGTDVPLAYPMMSGLDFGNKRLMGMGNIDLISEHHIDVIEERVKELKKEFPDNRVITSISGSSKDSWQEVGFRRWLRFNRMQFFMSTRIDGPKAWYDAGTGSSCIGAGCRLDKGGCREDPGNH